MQKSDELNDRFIEAVESGDLQATRWFLEKGADIYTINQSSGAKAFHIAAHKGHIDILKYLVSEGVDIHAIDHVNRNALNYIAIGLNIHMPCIEYLVAIGVDHNNKDSAGKSALERFKERRISNAVDFIEGYLASKTEEDELNNSIDKPDGINKTIEF